jgi:hypothetical protein
MPYSATVTAIAASSQRCQPPVPSADVEGAAAGEKRGGERSDERSIGRYRILGLSARAGRSASSNPMIVMVIRGLGRLSAR